MQGWRSCVKCSQDATCVAIPDVLWVVRLGFLSPVQVKAVLKGVRQDARSQCCEHCAEILELRREIAELRARLDGLSDTPGDAEDSRPSQAKIEQPPAVQPPRQMVLPSPAHGAPLPQVDQESSTKDKLGLCRTLFAGRSDVYAYRWENAADGTKGWSPKRRPGTTRDNPEYLPLTDDVITAHLTKDNPTACGLYAMLTDSTCRLLICDFDGGTWRLDAAAYAEAAAWAGVLAAIEISQSGEGADREGGQPLGDHRSSQRPRRTCGHVLRNVAGGAAGCGGRGRRPRTRSPRRARRAVLSSWAALLKYSVYAPPSSDVR